MPRCDEISMLEKPTIHVFIPVHNESKYLEATLNSIKNASDYYEKQGRQIQVTVSNNFSSDDSPKIISQFVERNPNWEFRNTSQLLSGDQHFNGLIQSCKTAYICIIGGHDLVSTSYFYNLEHCLTSNESAVLAFSKEFIDESGEAESAREAYFRYSFSRNLPHRFWQSIFYLGNATCIQGLIVTKYLQSINAFESQVSDLVWLHGILKFGTFSYSDKCAYVRTNPIRANGHRNPKIRKLTSNRKRMELALLEAWTPEEFSLINRRVAAFVIKLKFSSCSYKVGIFRILRKSSQYFFSPASGAKIYSHIPLHIQEIVSI